jgi:DMSO/TMAO reductase YedYZ molybdopterin-dependent catalytic subunit
MTDRLAESPLTADMDRRTFCWGVASGLPLAWAASAGPLVLGQTGGKGERRRKADRPAGLIPRQKDPDNLEFPFATLNSFITPNDQFFVRNHFPMPRLEARTWRLKVEGAVSRELELTCAELRKLPTHTVTATLECSGNNRAYLTPKAKGVPWQLGAVGNAEWTGVPLGEVLKKAGVAQSAVEVVLEGADQGEIPAEARPQGKVHFARSLPLARARKPEVLLAYRMNGAELAPAHGFPLRVVVPGWYGVASVKWLRRILVTERPFNGYFQSFDYSYFTRFKGLANVTPITELQIKAAIARPTAGEVIKAGAPYRIFGAAWTGDSEVSRVDVSTDGGRTWEKAKLLDKAVPYAWRLWSYAWRTPKKAGPARLLARATDARGRQQPLKRDPDLRNYLISHVLPVDVTVR